MILKKSHKLSPSRRASSYESVASEEYFYMNFDTWWWKGIAGLGLYVGGILTRPIQDWINQRRENIILRRALYLEIARVINEVAHILTVAKGDNIDEYHAKQFIKRVSFKCYEEASKEQIRLAGVSDISGINTFYDAAREFYDIDPNYPKFMDGIRIFAGGIRLFIGSGLLDGKLLLKYVNPSGKKFIEDIKKKPPNPA
jgi:hypothetical protein